MADAQGRRHVEASMALDQDLGLALRRLLHGRNAAHRLLEVGRRQLAVVLAEGIPLEALEAARKGGRRLRREFLRLLRAREPAVRVARHGVAALAAEKLPAGDAERLALDVPKRHVNRRKRAHEDGAAAPVGVAVVLVLDPRGVERVLANEGVLEVLERAEKRVLLVFERALAEARDSFVGLDLHEHPVRAKAVNDKRLDRCAFHGGTYLAFRVS